MGLVVFKVVGGLGRRWCLPCFSLHGGIAVDECRWVPVSSRVESVGSVVVRRLVRMV